MNDRSALLAFCTVLVSAGTAFAQAPAKAPTPAPPPAAAPVPAPQTAPAPAAAPAATPSAAPTTTPAAPPASSAPAGAESEEDDDEDEESDSDESPAVPKPNTSPAAIFQARTNAPAPAPVPDVPEPDDGLMGTHQNHWFASVGLRESYVVHEGYDIFSENNALPQLTAYVGRTLFVNGPWSVAGLLLFDAGSSEADLRGSDTRLDATRLTLGAEARYQVLRRLYAFGRIAPGALNVHTTIQDRVVGKERSAEAWLFATDLSAGAAFEFAGDRKGNSKHPRGWLGVEGGYGWAQATKLEYGAEEITSPVRLEPLSLGEVAVRGGFFRVVATATY